MTRPLLAHRWVTEAQVGPMTASMEYLVAGNGCFVRLERPELRVIAPLARHTMRGLATLQPRFEMVPPRVPEAIVTAIYAESLRAAMTPTEALFHLVWDGGVWECRVPPQRRSRLQVVPVGKLLGSSYESALIEAHSHQAAAPFFSSGGPESDDADEIGFRIYAVLGWVSTRPTLRVRVGLFGHYWEIPADWVFDLPEGIHDAGEVDRGGG